MKAGDIAASFLTWQPRGKIFCPLCKVKYTKKFKNQVRVVIPQKLTLTVSLKIIFFGIKDTYHDMVKNVIGELVLKYKMDNNFIYARHPHHGDAV